MKIKTTGNANGDSWYDDYVGNIFEVEATKEYGMDYKVVGASKAKLLETDTDGTVNYYISKEDCEEVKEMPKFNIGSKVIVRDGTSDDGRTGEIIERGTMYPWRIRYDSDGSTELFYESDLELVEPQWMDKATALKLCIDGAKVMSADDGASALYYMDFNGTNFEWHLYGKDSSGIVNTMPTRFKLWTPPTPPKPKFAVDELCLDQDLFYAVVFHGTRW